MCKISKSLFVWVKALVKIYGMNRKREIIKAGRIIYVNKYIRFYSIVNNTCWNIGKNVNPFYLLQEFLKFVVETVPA